ncbi:MAG: hypothetical protein HDQ87_11820 [Clostridia bacterium]|nr:hypothetical protein [Clostridia bacterium]
MPELWQAAACCGYNFRLWRGSARVAVTFSFAFILCYFMTERAADFAREHQTHLQILEPFVWMFGDGTNILLCSLLLVLLLGDMPFISAGTPFFLLRTSRQAWLLGQVAYIVCSTLIYLLFVLASTCLLSAPVAFPGDQWSEAAALLGFSGLGQRSGIPVDTTTLKMGRPLECALVTFVLVLLYMLALGLLMMTVHLWKGRRWALAAVAAYSLWGLLLEPAFFAQIMHLPEGMLYRANVIAGWLSPLNQACYPMHSFGYDKLPRIWQSCVLFLTGSAALYLAARDRVRRFSFLFTGTDA